MKYTWSFFQENKTNYYWNSVFLSYVKIRSWLAKFLGLKGTWGDIKYLLGGLGYCNWLYENWFELSSKRPKLNSTGTYKPGSMSK
jgi:hypothetical protein